MLKPISKVKLKDGSDDEQSLILLGAPKDWNLEEISYGYQLHTEPIGTAEEDVFTILYSGGQCGKTALTVIHTQVDMRCKVLFSEIIKGFGVAVVVNFEINKVIDEWNGIRKELNKVK